MESKELAIRLARALDAKKAVNVHILAVEDLTTVTEYFVIATGMSAFSATASSDLSASAIVTPCPASIIGRWDEFIISATRQMSACGISGYGS